MADHLLAMVTPASTSAPTSKASKNWCLCSLFMERRHPPVINSDV